MRSTPGLDGLRAIAIAAVVLGHAGVAALPGGELGIDVLLVVSGYVVTRFLLERYAEQRRADVDAPRAVRGSRAFQTLHVRRARRLLPALVLLLAVCLTTTALFVRDQLEVVRTDALGALAFVQNWQLVAQHRDPAAEPSVLSHLWVLAIEAQLVLGWSVVVLLVLWRVGLGGAGGPRLRALAVGGALASCALMWVLAVLRDVPAGAARRGCSSAPTPAPRASCSGRQRRSSGRASGSPGCGCQGQAQGRWTSSASPASWSSGGSCCRSTSVRRCSTAAACSCSPAPPCSSSSRPRIPGPWWAGCCRCRCSGLGRRTYGLFLWHWPVVVLVQPEHGVPWSGAALLWLQLGLVLAPDRGLVPPRRGAAAPRPFRGAGRGGRERAGPPQRSRRGPGNRTGVAPRGHRRVHRGGRHRPGRPHHRSRGRGCGRAR